MLHGWRDNGNDGSAIDDFKRTLKNSKEGTGWGFWSPSYDSIFTPFTKNADDIWTNLKKYQKDGMDLSRVVLIGYSMGGLVARQLVVNGLDILGLLTMCSPHTGLFPLLPQAAGAGEASLTYKSTKLIELNKEARDIENRGKYRFLGVTYTDRGGKHMHDMIVEYDSAMGKILDGVGKRIEQHLDYGNNMFAEWTPHQYPPKPTYAPEGIANAKELLLF